MTIALTIEVPDELATRLQSMQNRLPEILERGMRDVLVEQSNQHQDETEIIAILASSPSPEQVLDIHPSPTMQKRASELLEYNKQRALTTQEMAELEKYALLEHLVRMAKAHAYKKLVQQ